MKRSAAATLLAVLAATLSLGDSTPLAPPRFGKSAIPIEGYGTHRETKMFEAQQHVQVIVTGNGGSLLGLYVYDPDGNCVAWDDAAGFTMPDDLVVEWTTHRAGTYMIEVKNLSVQSNVVQRAINRIEPVRARGPAEKPEKNVLPVKMSSPFASSLNLPTRTILRKPFVGGQRASIVAVGDQQPPVRLDIEVRDPEGRLVARSSGAEGICAAVWYPPRDGEYFITLAHEREEAYRCWIASKSAGGTAAR